MLQNYIQDFGYLGEAPGADSLLQGNYAFHDDATQSRIDMLPYLQNPVDTNPIIPSVTKDEYK